MSHELLRAASFVVHNRILVAAFLGATFLVADAPPLLVAAASRHRRFSSPPLLVDVVGRRSFVAIAAAVAASPFAGKQSHADCAAARRGLGKAALHFGISECHVTRLAEEDDKSALLGWLSVSSRGRIYLLERSF